MFLACKRFVEKVLFCLRASKDAEEEQRDEITLLGLGMKYMQLTFGQSAGISARKTEAIRLPQSYV
jgi:hypothetical protein